MSENLRLTATVKSDLNPSSLMFKPLGNFRKNEIIFSEGEAAARLYRINAGYVKVVRTTELGEESSLDILGEGALVAEWDGLFERSAKHSYSAISISEKTQISALNISRLEEIQRENLRIYLFPHLMQELVKTKTREANLRLKTAGTKILNLLAYFSKTLGKAYRDHVLLDLPLSHLDYASLSGCSRQTFTSYLVQLERAQLLRYSRGRILLYPAFFNQIN